MKNSQKGSAVLIVIIILAVLAIGGGIYYKHQKNTQSVQNSNNNNNNQATTTTFGENTINIQVEGMQQYTDAEFGFSFWYPKTWQVKVIPNSQYNSIDHGTVVKTLQIGEQGGVAIREVHSTDLRITDSGGAGPFGPITYYFDTKLHTWMVTPPTGAEVGNQGTHAADTTRNTMGGLHMFGGTSRFDTTIIPISADNFVVVSDGGGANAMPLAKTVVALDPDVATPVSIVEQTKVVQDEAYAYNIQAWRTYKNTRLGFSIDLPTEPVYVFSNQSAHLNVFENGNSNIAYIAPEATTFDGLHYVPTTFDDLDANGRHGKYPVVVFWQMEFRTVKDDGELLKFIQDRFGSGCSIGQKIKKDDLFDVKIQGDGLDLSNTKCPVNFRYSIKYSPLYNRVVSWDLGQDIRFTSDPQSSKPAEVYDTDISNSFRFIKPE